MKTILNKKEGHISLNPEIYPKELVQKAVNDFKLHTKISLDKSRVLLETDQEKFEKLAFEFCNYLIMLRKDGI